MVVLHDLLDLIVASIVVPVSFVVLDQLALLSDVLIFQVSLSYELLPGDCWRLSTGNSRLTGVPRAILRTPGGEV